MIRKALLAGFLAVSLASCGQPAPCPPAAPLAPAGQQSMIDEAFPVVLAGFRSGGSFRSSGFRSGGSSFSRRSGSTFNSPRFSTPSKPVYRSYSKPSYGGNTTIINRSSGGGSNGMLWGLGGYFLGQHMAQSQQDRCK